MEITKQLIQRFFQEDCSKKEKQEIVDFFRDNPEELELYFSEEEWKHIESEGQIDTSVSERIWGKVEDALQAKKVRRIRMRKWAVAASILFLISASLVYLLKPKEITLSTSTIHSAKLDTINNSTDSSMHITLTDGSLVELYPGSEIQFHKEFDADKREVILIGEADFKVKKDSTRPFSVFSDEVTTTVLGTVFKVKARSMDSVIVVELFSGKVEVNTLQKQGQEQHRYVLDPGQIFCLNKITHIAKVGSIKKKNLPAGSKLIQNELETVNGGLNNWYMFNNQSLAAVLENLKAIYGVDIRYNESDLEGLSVIGKIEVNESLATLLDDIAKLNGLVIEKKGKVYFVSRR